MTFFRPLALKWPFWSPGPKKWPFWHPQVQKWPKNDPKMTKKPDFCPPGPPGPLFPYAHLVLTLVPSRSADLKAPLTEKPEKTRFSVNSRFGPSRFRFPKPPFYIYDLRKIISSRTLFFHDFGQKWRFLTLFSQKPDFSANRGTPQSYESRPIRRFKNWTFHEKWPKT